MYEHKLLVPMGVRKGLMSVFAIFVMHSKNPRGLVVPLHSAQPTGCWRGLFGLARKASAADHL